MLPSILSDFHTPSLGPVSIIDHLRPPALRSNALPTDITVRNLSKDVFERRTSTGSEAFFLFICLEAIKFSLLTFFSLLKTIYPRVLAKPLPNDAKSPLPVDVRRSKTLLLKLPSSQCFTFARFCDTAPLKKWIF